MGTYSKNTIKVTRFRRSLPGLQNLLFPPIISPHHQNVSHLWLIGPAHFLLYLNPSLFCSDHFVCSPAICQGLFAVVYSISALFCLLKFIMKHQSSPFLSDMLEFHSFTSSQTVFSWLRGFVAAWCISTFSSGVSTQLVPIQLLVLIFLGVRMKQIFFYI